MPAKRMQQCAKVQTLQAVSLVHMLFLLVLRLVPFRPLECGVRQQWLGWLLWNMGLVHVVPLFYLLH